MDDLNSPSYKMNGKSNLGFSGQMKLENGGRTTKYGDGKKQVKISTNRRDTLKYNSIDGTADKKKAFLQEQETIR